MTWIALHQNVDVEAHGMPEATYHQVQSLTASWLRKGSKYLRGAGVTFVFAELYLY